MLPHTTAIAAHDVRLEMINMDSCVLPPKPLLRQIVKAADSFFTPSRFMIAAWNLAEHHKANLGAGMRRVWSFIRPQKSPAVVLYRDNRGAFWLAEGADKIAAAKTNGNLTISAIVLRGERENAVTHSLRNVVKNAVDAKHTATEADASARARDWHIKKIKQWAVRTALGFDKIAALSNHVVGELIGVSKEIVRTARVLDDEESIEDPTKVLKDFLRDAYLASKHLARSETAIAGLRRLFPHIPTHYLRQLVFSPQELGFAA